MYVFGWGWYEYAGGLASALWYVGGWGWYVGCWWLSEGDECCDAAREWVWLWLCGVPGTELEFECEGVACRDLLCCRHSCCPLARSASPIAPWSPECW